MTEKLIHSLRHVDLFLKPNRTDDNNTTRDDVDGTSSVKYYLCSNHTPTTAQLLSLLPLEGCIIIGALGLFTILTVGIFIEEICFARRYFHKVTRKLLVLACYPIFSVAGLIGVIVPRAGPLTDLIANTFFATCLYNFGILMVCYMGGSKLMWNVIDPERQTRLAVPPCGCFCCCIGSVHFKRSVFQRIRCLVLQVAIVRPILMFLALALWADGSYHPGHYHITSAFTYISILNMASTMTAVYGLMLFKNTFQQELGPQFLISGKIFCIQLTLLLSIVPNVIINILVRLGIIGCGPLLPTKARGDVIYHGFLVVTMLPLALLAQKFFRRRQDAVDCGSDIVKQAVWIEALSRVDAKGWMSLGETVV